MKWVGEGKKSGKERLKGCQGWGAHGRAGAGTGQGREGPNVPEPAGTDGTVPANGLQHGAN